MGLVLARRETKPAYLIGIDPGASGGISFLGGAEMGYAAHKMPPSYRDILDLLMPMSGWAHAYIEKVSPMPKEGVSSVFKFGQNYGALRMALVACRIPMHTVTPQVWCKGMGLKKRKEESNTAWKNRHKAMAQELFPGVKITHATADALLIAEWGRRHGRASEAKEE